MIKLIKIIRFSQIYGINRALNKAFGRMRNPIFRALYLFPRKKNISIIGCGQFAFSCIAFFIKKNKGNVFLGCYDTNPNNAASLAKYYSFKTIHSDYLELVKDPSLDVVYIASNHNTHTDYALAAIEAKKIAYIEKPLSTTYEQFIKLIHAQRSNNATIFVGYNRPYSKAISQLSHYLQKKEYTDSKAFSLCFFISGHLILPEHWYRKPEEGTRVCGNIGHWIDLTIHMFFWRKEQVNLININITYSSAKERDDNVCICFSTDLGDIVSIMLSSRTEPFEGINETINFQYGDIIAKIDDFRNMTIWDNHKLIKKRYFPKDVGHQRAVLQPFFSDNRNWTEVEVSTLLMLKIKDMVINGTTQLSIDLNDMYKTFEKDVEIELNEANYTKP